MDAHFENRLVERKTLRDALLTTENDERHTSMHIFVPLQGKEGVHLLLNELFAHVRPKHQLDWPDDARIFDLLSLAASDTNLLKARAAVRALGLLKDPRALDLLVSLLQHPDSRLRIVAIAALRHLRDLRAVEPLLLATTDPDEEVRVIALWVLGQSKDLRALPHLLSNLQEQSR